ncbi:hypothetical protein MUN89_10985 [Halobacillus salinarum]|uniref:Uncharacterized protein n=1 Tax=Halobacillus salinarum TaxID=2932257 RepID=A0ABY4EF36_9BACI|nr:hypothetical protein [Halobacillus salinarum]UOQ42513.1 hypothetical protein MUN89_10985 [Halobacillus salinarum]
MKHTLRSFAIGLIAATALISFAYWKESPSPVSTQNEELSSKEMIKKIESIGYHVLDSKEFEQLKNESQTTSTQAEQTSKKEAIYYLTLDIDSGTTSSDISKKLKQAKIIDDEKAFETYMKDHKYSKYIQIGSVLVDSSMSTKQLAQAITHKE